MALGAGLLAALVSPVWAIAGTGILLGFGFGASLWAFDRGVWTDMQLPFMASVGTMIIMLAVRWLLEEREKRHLNAAFKTYLSAEVIDEMAERGELPTLGGKEYVITPLFTDIQGFSSFSELLTPEQLVTLLNEYLGSMTDILLHEKGTFDKYIGDAIVAFWGAPSIRPDHAASAVRTAVRMQRELSRLRAKWVSEGDKWPSLVHGMRMRIGLNTGVAVIGNMGTHNRMQYTMMGDNVNLAARLESGSKQYGVYILVAAETVRQAGEEFLTRELDLVRVMGKSEPVAVHEVLCETARASQARRELIERWGRARALYLAGDFALAQDAFGACVELEPWRGEPGVKTCPSLVFQKRCQHFQANPPEAWDGIWTATEK
jgi:adenylate cyclase